MAIEVGQEAPDFTLRSAAHDAVTLSSYRGQKNVVLVFYPWAFTGVCSGELDALQAERAGFDNDTTALLAVSVDSMYALRVFAEQQGLEFPLLSDFWPHGATARSYGVFHEDAGAAVRGTFVIDTAGVVRWSVVNGIGDARDIEEYKKALADL